VERWKGGKVERWKGGKVKWWKGVLRWKGGKVKWWKGGKVKWWKGGKVKWWKGAPETSPPSYILCHHGKSGPLWGDLPVIQSFETTIKPRNKHSLSIYCVIPASEPESSAQGWQNLFATETGGLFQTGNSVASAERT